LLIRISSPGTDAHGGPLAFSGYGTQVQDKAIFGKIPEATISISYSTQTYTLPDGGSYELRTPSYSLLNMYLPQSGYLLSPRLAPPVFGLGLLDAIPESDILLHADATDQNQDGISGKANWVWDPHQKKNMLGRFGLKCNTATLHTQVAAAYNHDMGITNPVFPEETIQGQTQMDGLSDDPELSAEILDAAVFYVRTLQVPSRRLVSDSKAQRGEKLFLEAGCEKCHTSTFYTRVDVGFPALSHQRIHPYSDLLLHDMGEGLADHRDDYQADGREWRTKPLWGLGLIEKVNYPGYYLHDGRARSMLEAVMWHDGEAKTSTDFVKQLSKADREALLFFLKSL
ncbi:MAG TPA: di-heme oxidoredictase family protein, partial [Chitinophagaceae bacterium]|nr:di-heme oxidoredictase family protein [Chitinophagaceae bacterium]